MAAGRVRIRVRTRSKGPHYEVTRSAAPNDALRRARADSSFGWSKNPRPEPNAIPEGVNDLGPAQFQHGSTLLGGWGTPTVKMKSNLAHLHAGGASASATGQCRAARRCCFCCCC
jgi:hypothetical protein